MLFLQDMRWCNSLAALLFYSLCQLIYNISRTFWKLLMYFYILILYWGFIIFVIWCFLFDIPLIYTSFQTDWDITAIQDCGQPGFTLAERRRFSNILSMWVGQMRISIFLFYIHLSFFLIAVFLFVLLWSFF